MGLRSDEPHSEIAVATRDLYGPAGLIVSNVAREPESAAYGACAFNLNGLAVRFRVAKITPRKIGQFVTLWKRNATGPIQPFDHRDPIDFFIVACRSGDRSGQFIFSKALLSLRGVIAQDGRGGKRALRIYPPWDVPTSRLAAVSQAWQRDCFVEMRPGYTPDPVRLRALFGLPHRDKPR